MFALLVAPLAALGSAHAGPESHACDPPRTHVALVPLTDATDRTWAGWSGADPVTIVLGLLADSLEKSRGRAVTRLAAPPGPASRPVDDAAAIAAAKAVRAEVVVTGVLSEFVLEDNRQGGKLSRWGVGALDSRSRARVRVSLRVLGAADGDVILESTIDRERTGRGTASADRQGDPARAQSGLLAGTLEEVLRELVEAVDRRLDMRWQASVLRTAPGACVLDAGAARGLFVGQRLDVWRSGVETYDEDFVRLSEEIQVGVIEIVGLEGRDRAHARVLEGEVIFGDRARPCSVQPPVAATFRR